MIRVLGGVQLQIPSIELTKNPNPNEENKEAQNIEVFTNPRPNLLIIPKS